MRRIFADNKIIDADKEQNMAVMKIIRERELSRRKQNPIIEVM